MMGPAHSLSGAAAWLGVGAAAAAFDHPMPWPVLLVGALLCAGAALAPDLEILAGPTLPVRTLEGSTTA